MADSAEITAGTNGTADQYNNLRKDVHLAKTISATETDGATITIDWSLIASGKVRNVTLGGNRTIAFSNTTTDQWLIINLIQDGAGSRTVTWPSGIKWPDALAPVLSTAAAAIDTFLIHCAGAGSSYRGYFAGFNLS